MEVTQSNMRAVWQHIIPHCANDFVGFQTNFEEVTNNIVEIGKELGFKELDSDNVIECINSNTKELDNESLLNIEEQRAYEEEEINLSDDAEINEIPSKVITHEQLAKILRQVETLSEEIMDIDPNVERSIKVSRNLKNVIQCYKDMYEEKKPKKKFVQTTLTQFFGDGNK